MEQIGLDVNQKNNDGNAPLNIAATYGKIDIVKYLIEELKCSPRCPGQLGRSPLHNDCEKNGNIEMVKYLVEKHRCDLSGRDEQGNTPLNVAASSGSLGILKYLIEEKNWNLRSPGQLGRSPLHNACRKKGNLEMVKYLVEKHGCDPNTKDENGSNSVHMAALSGSIDILIYLIEEIECDPRCLGLWGRSLLHSACQNNLEMVKYLMEKTGCNLFIKDEHGSTPLDLVITWNKEPMIKYFRDKLGIPYQHIHYVRTDNHFFRVFQYNCTTLFYV